MCARSAGAAGADSTDGPAQPWGSIPSDSGLDRSVWVGGLQPGSTYSFRLLAVNSCGASAPSPPCECTHPPDTAVSGWTSAAGLGAGVGPGLSPGLGYNTAAVTPEHPLHVVSISAQDCCHPCPGPELSSAPFELPLLAQKPPVHLSPPQSALTDHPGLPADTCAGMQAPQ